MSLADGPLLASNNPFAQVILTAKAAIAGKKLTGDALLTFNLELARRLLSKNFEKKKIRALMTFLRNYVHFENQEMINKFGGALEVMTQQNHRTMGIEEFLLDRAKQEGGMEKQKRIAQNLLRQTNFTSHQIAEIVDIPVAVVDDLKATLKRDA